MVYAVDQGGYADHKRFTAEDSRSVASVSSNDAKVESPVIVHDRTKTTAHERHIVIKESEHIAQRRVLYLGAAIPSSHLNGIESIQEPLAKRYPVRGEEHVCGIEAWLTVDENGLQFQFLDDPSVMLYYPIRSLAYCAGVRYVKQPKITGDSSRDCRFVSLEDPETDHVDNAENPPLFVVTLQRTRHSAAKECHCFVTKTKTAALELVKACIKAYYSTDSTQDCSRAPLFFKVDSDGSAMKEVQKGIHIAPASSQEHVVNYASSRQGSGFFYKTDKVSINCWLLSEHHRSGNRRTSSEHSSGSKSSRPCHRHRSRSTRTPVLNSKPTASLSAGYPSEQQVSRDSGPYTPIPESPRMQRVKDEQLGRDVYVRWINGMPPIPEQFSLAQTPNYNAKQGLNVDYPTEKPLTKEMNRLGLNGNPANRLTPHGSKPSVTPVHQERNKSEKKQRQHQHQGYEIIEDYFVEPAKLKQSKKTHRHWQRPYEQSFTSPLSPFRQPEYPAHTVSHVEHPTPTYLSERSSKSPLFYQDYPKSPYPQQQQQQQQQGPQVSFSQKEFPQSPYTPQQQPQIFVFPLDQKDFVVPSLNDKPHPQSGVYSYHMMQPFVSASNPNSTTPYWFFTI